jgi:hypothetical protein
MPAVSQDRPGERHRGPSIPGPLSLQHRIRKYNSLHQLAARTPCDGSWLDSPRACACATAIWPTGTGHCGFRTMCATLKQLRRRALHCRRSATRSASVSWCPPGCLSCCRRCRPDAQSPAGFGVARAVGASAVFLHDACLQTLAGHAPCHALHAFSQSHHGTCSRLLMPVPTISRHSTPPAAGLDAHDDPAYDIRLAYPFTSSTRGLAAARPLATW